MRIPKLCRHKGTGQGYATDPATGKEVYFGRHGTPECAAAYTAWLQQFQARRETVRSGRPPGMRVKVWQLCEDFGAWMRGYYRKHGQPTTEQAFLRRVVKQVADRHGTEWADEFTPGKLLALREEWVRAGHARGYVNAEASRVCAIWRWGVEQELVPATVLQALRAVRGLRLGRTAAPEETPVVPVPLEVVGETLFRLDGRTAALVRVHLYGCMRAQDAVRIRPCDVDRTQDPWLYVPWTHKTEHHGRARRLWLGPACQEILAARLPDVGDDDWLFTGHNEFRHLTVSGYKQRIAHCCRRHGLPHWCPAQLRHTALTEVRKRYGLEGAQHAGGHAHAQITEIYAERDEAFARKIAREMWR